MYYYHPRTGRFEQQQPRFRMIIGKVPRKHFRFLRKKSRFLPQVPQSLSVPSTRSAATRSGSYIPRRAYDDEVLYVPFRTTSQYHQKYDTTGNDYYTRSQVNRELLMSSAALEDNFDISARSRQRDRDVLSAANRAILPQARIYFPPPTPSPSVTTTPSYDTSSGGISEARRGASLRRSKLRSSSVPANRSAPVTNTTTTIIPLDLTASPPPRPSPYLNYSNSLHTTSSLRNNTYRPLYSRALHTSTISPSRELSPYRDESPFRDISPYRAESPLSTGSGTDGSVEHWYPAGSDSSVRKPRKPRVLSTKRKMGNYYGRLLNRRGNDGKMGKYWPYIDVDDIENVSVGELLSDTDSVGESGITYKYRGGNEGGYNYNSEAGAGETALVTYTPNYDSDSDIPSDYVPFRPRARYRSPERDYSDLSVIPYMPQRDPTKNSVSDDIAFNALVAASAARARQALERVNLDEYDSASMVFSVEGEYHSPQSDVPLGFKYVSRPLALKTPASAIVSVYDSDDSFTKYMTDLKRFREGIRKRLEDGYKALEQESRSYRPALTSSSYVPYTSRPSTELTPYRKRLREDSQYKYGQSLELYPLESSRRSPSPSRSRSRQRSVDALPESRAIKLYDSKSDADSRLSTVAKVQIKAATELHTSPRSAVAVRRAMRGHSTPPGPIYVPTSANVSMSEAALLGSKVDVTLPKRRRPRSAYAQAKVRQINIGSSSRDASPVEAAAAVAVETAGLKAHKPVCQPTQSKPIQNVDGPAGPNLMSWQYRIDAYTPPEDLVFVPRSLASVKSKLRDCKDKLDRHKQLMDRYLVTDTGLSVDDMQVLMNIKSRAPPQQPALTLSVTADKYQAPMSAVRRKARRVLRVSKGVSDY